MPRRLVAAFAIRENFSANLWIPLRCRLWRSSSTEIDQNDLYTFGHDGFNLVWREPSGRSQDNGGIGRERAVGAEVTTLPMLRPRRVYFIPEPALAARRAALPGFRAQPAPDFPGCALLDQFIMDGQVVFVGEHRCES
jgi:hypothetical protein